MAKKLVKIILGGSQINEVSTEAATWGELYKQTKKDISYPGEFTAILGETKSILIEPSVLPDAKVVEGTQQAIHIFINPVKSKSGSIDVDSMSYKDLKNAIKNIRESNKKAADFFGDYTHMSTQQLKEVLKRWYTTQPQGSAVSKPKEEVKTPTPKQKFAEALIQSEVKEKSLVSAKKTTFLDLSNPGDTLDSLIQWLQALKEGVSNKELPADKLVFTVEKVSERDFDAMKDYLKK